MLQINELRTGNKLLYENRIVEVMGIHKSGRVNLDPDGYIDQNELMPAPLNREWLMEFGFDETAREVYQHRQLTEIFSTLNEYFFRYDGKIIATCKYVHELQNIFFALYKEEIKLKVSTCYNLNQSLTLSGESFFIEKKPEIQVL
jgi:hypothetical protein